jgi:hypothetical protein
VGGGEVIQQRSDKVKTLTSPLNFFSSSSFVKKISQFEVMDVANKIESGTLNLYLALIFADIIDIPGLSQLFQNLAMFEVLLCIWFHLRQIYKRQPLSQEMRQRRYTPLVSLLLSS